MREGGGLEANARASERAGDGMVRILIGMIVGMIAGMLLFGSLIERIELDAD
ncbi:MAG: hypothetical protein VX911_03715 [Candidatus Latescibacterota bacterium]|nr:hypothetical protein [Candidatus Latescibacterota bacterium]